MLIGIRLTHNIVKPIKKFKTNKQLINQPIIAFSQSDLWNPYDNKDNWILTAGKIENLRIASQKLNGIEIKANEVFSFWKHIGNPNIGQKYVLGREIREGCIVPTIAGGLCQISNALYDAALSANFDIIERHKHTKVIKGSLAEKDRDATVKWNYVDLRFKSDFDFRIEIYLSSDKLIVNFKSNQKNIKYKTLNSNNRSINNVNDCYSCGNFSCFKHPDQSSKKNLFATTTYIIDEKWPEFDKYLKSTTTNLDHFIIPFKKNSLLKTNRYSWSALNEKKTRTASYQGIYRALKLRLTPKNKNNVFELSLQLDKKLAYALSQKIFIDSTHLVISQNLLPFIYETGSLGGRTFDVLMTRLPFENIHNKLDLAYSNHPESKTLNDFRASKYLIDLENKALNKARKIITPHSEIAEIFKNKVIKIAWEIPLSKTTITKGSKILFPASVVGRKGGYTIQKIAKDLNVKIVVAGRIIENKDFWNKIELEQFNGDFDQIGLVIYPTYIENQPRLLLKAIAKGIPIITTKSCGIEGLNAVKIIESNNAEQLKNEMTQLLKKID